MTGIVVTGAPRVPLDQLDALAGYGVATVHEAQGRSGLLRSWINPIQEGVRVSGSAVTATVAPGDNTMIAVAVEQCQAGDILVVTPTSPSEMGYFGDLLATSLKARGVRGLVIDSGVRDVADLKALEFPVWSRCIVAEGTTKGSLGDVNVPISIAGQIVHPGDAIVADDDGVVVVPRACAAAVVIASREREEKEERSRRRYEQGEIALDVNNMRSLIEKAGIRYVDYQDWKGTEEP
ncbi:4-carboxy-4-hydroxy-2-oxoadipate aldolase/oxaloacetate decarboxylase [Microbacterium pseudoresistens]|uniref:Putative 4-hydroxy-4-methyl-2-oxoglutarate aldolase n=1 Tax=Microbacterium pseudoresistens TaxID=640634 RepID=A0A7Y9EVS3_9MICO|nr:4-carboxy-4-hydroxy-2-oxoadipate aldolase/oxaloacetate decarboxylase [Microbacterium pseudoresistens]NYD54872.1 4-hydroxy-4-methyl-2-oxoglutarate aldolase [Microbacterium pseudoresistens]